MAGRYGIGARVRDREGDLAEVIGKPEKGYRNVRIIGGKYDGMTYWASKSELSPVAVDVAETASCCAEKGEVAFAVGDRVVAGGGDPAGRVGVIELADTDGTYDVKFDDWSGGHSGSARDGSMNHWWCDAEQLRPFAIEAGKFYRTRDGRKVGPMTVWDNEVEHSFDSAGGERIWRQDGTSVYEPDIVAEWIEPVATAAPAEPWTDFDHWDAPPEKIVVEDATDPVWVPKVGDKIRRIKSPYDFVPIGYESTITRLPSGFLGYVDADGDTMQFVADRWELVPAVKPQQDWLPAVGDKIRWLGKFDADMLTVGAVYEIVRNGGTGWVGITDNNQTRGDHSWDIDGIIENFELVTAPPLLIGQAVTASGYISGANGSNFSVVFGDRSYDLPATLLKKAA